MIEKCLLASDEISTLEVLNSSTVTGIVNQLESLKVTRLVVTDHSGAALYDSSGASVGTYVLLPEILQALTVSKQAPEGNNVFTWTYHDGITDSRAATPIVYYGTVVGCVYMTEYDTTQGTLIKSLQQTLLRITLMLEIIVAAFSVAFSNAFSRRLNRIMASMRIIREGDYSHKVDMGGSDELTVLGEEFNDLTERLQTSERKRSQFVSDASHELRTPLTNVRSYAETIREAGDDLSRETENDFLDVVISETDRMTHIVQDLLTLSRLDAGNAELVLSRFPFGDAIESVTRANALAAKQHGHTLTYTPPESLPLIVGDRSRLEQVMMNVIGNAVKYTPDGGHIRVTAGTVGERVWMEVADDGIGIPEADRSRIFERFYRVDKARSRESGGTGLGLSIAQEILNQHKGSIEISSEYGKGTSVLITMPAAEAQA